MAEASDGQRLLAHEPGSVTTLYLRRRLDRSRPLWQMWLLPGLPDRRVGFYMRVHHAIADGAAGVATLAASARLAAIYTVTSRNGHSADQDGDGRAEGGRGWTA